MRTLDSAGRICIPKDLRAAYNLTENTDIQIIDNGNGIILIPANRPYTITSSDMDALRRLYLMLNESGFLDSEYQEKLSKITRETDMKCQTCETNMFLTNENTYKCYKCE